MTAASPLCCLYSVVSVTSAGPCQKHMFVYQISSVAACVTVSVCVSSAQQDLLCLSSPIARSCVSVCVFLCVRFLCIWVSVSSAGCISGCEFPFPVSSPGAPPLPDDLCVVFVVELDKGPYGLGMGLIDGLVSRHTF